ncbi:hypothetical protein OUZ56_009448 [Daphnia magna]|uniref:Uncharacterized protein n=1 Tax=Daphnia magna TaxID=35525 RepID=A0ABR0AGF6_9CRUS|nr:hypothetical protein OUZ56_009448 [Daphnia magna]
MVVDLELSGLGEVKIAPPTVVGLCVSMLGEYPSGHWYMANAIQIKPTIHPMATIVEPIANKSFSFLLRKSKKNYEIFVLLRRFLYERDEWRRKFEL